MHRVHTSYIKGTKRKKRKNRGGELNKDEMKKLIFKNSYLFFFSSYRKARRKRWDVVPCKIRKERTTNLSKLVGCHVTRQKVN
jgi:hypothetical protein